MPESRILIYLLRKDLRLADNPVFHEIHRASQEPRKTFTHVLPIYIFSAQQIEASSFLAHPGARSPFPEARSETGHFWRCGPHRAKFLAESVWDLKGDLERVGSGLVIRVGMMGQVIEDLLRGFKTRAPADEVVSVWMTEEEGVEEKREERAVREATRKAGVDFKLWMDEKYFIDE